MLHSGVCLICEHESDVQSAAGLQGENTRYFCEWKNLQRECVCVMSSHVHE